MLRIFTALIVIGISVVTAICGFRVVEFVRWQKDTTTEKTEAEFRWWREIPAVRAAAVDTEFREMAKRRDLQSLKKQESILADALELRPLATTYWMSLAEIGMQTIRPRQTVLSYLEISSITGPNEASIMWRRAIFGILQWDILDPAARNRVVEDLAGITQNSTTSTTAYVSLSKLLAELSAERRIELARMLREKLLTPRDLAQLGLQSANSR